MKVQKEYTAAFSSPTPSPLRSAPKIQEQVTAAVSQPPAAESHVSSSNTFENGNGQESEGAWSLNCSGVFFSKSSMIVPCMLLILSMCMLAYLTCLFIQLVVYRGSFYLRERSAFRCDDYLA